MRTKLLGAWLVGKHAAGRVTGSITYTSGINAYRPNGSNTIVAAANGALASLAYGLAIELAPVRVNVVSPGWVDTAIWDQLPMDKQAAFAALAERLPARRIGTPATSPRRFFVAAQRVHHRNGPARRRRPPHRLSAYRLV